MGPEGPEGPAGRALASIRFGYYDCDASAAAQGQCSLNSESSSDVEVSRVRTAEGWTWFCVSGVPEEATSWIGSARYRQDLNGYTGYWAEDDALTASGLRPSAAQLAQVGCSDGTDLIVSNPQDVSHQQDKPVWTLWFS